MPDVSFTCNALIPGRRAKSFLRIFTRPAGNWIFGKVRLERDRLIFSTNALNALHQEDASDLMLAYGDVSSVDLGRLGVFLRTVDLETRQGTVRFRCLFSSNETLLAALRSRMQGRSGAAPA